MLKKLMIPLKIKIGQWLISIGVFALNATAQNTITVLLLAPRFCNIFPENFHVNGDLNFALNLLIGFFSYILKILTATFSNFHGK